MLTVDEITKLSLFSTFKLISGEAGLHNEISNMVILEYESISNHFEVFSPGDFVLTSLFFAKDDISLLDIAFKKLFEIKVSAIAIKTVFYDDIPKHLKDLAKKNKIPIFIFNDSYMEDLIICVNELLKNKQQYLALEEKINTLINIEPSSYTVQKTALEINPYFSNNILIAYITPKDDKESIIPYFNKMLYKKYKPQVNFNYSYVKYKNGMLIAYTHDDNKFILNDIFQFLLKKIDMDSNKFYIGISNQHSSLHDFHICIKESIYSNHLCKVTQSNITYYNNIGVYKFLYPIFFNESIKRYYTEIITSIKDYDNKYTSNILDTLISYVNNNGEISKTAAELFQHPNTIRYRLNKTKDILKDYNFDDNFYEEMFIIIKLYLLL